MSLGGLYLEGLIHEGAYFRNFTVFNKTLTMNFNIEPSFENTFLAWIFNRKRAARRFFHIF